MHIFRFRFQLQFLLAIELVSFCCCQTLNNAKNIPESREDVKPPDENEEDFKVVIGGDNEIRIEDNPNVEKLSSSESQSTLLNYYEQDNETVSKELDPLLTDFSKSENKSNNSNYSEVSLSTNFVEEYESPTFIGPLLPPVHNHRNVLPSFSKIPDHLSNHLSDVENIEPNDRIIEQIKLNGPKKSRPLLHVPVGSRVHTVKYKDYSNPEATEIVNQYYGKYESSIIELPSSQPVLPIVFNFRTQSSPIITSQTRTGSQVPTTQYMQTNEPPHYRSHVIHKPIIQDLREIIVPYRFYIQEIAPVQQYQRTIVSRKCKHCTECKSKCKSRVRKMKHTPVFLTNLNRYKTSENYLKSYHSNKGMSQHNRPATPVQSAHPKYTFHMPYRVQDLYKNSLPTRKPNHLPYNSFNHYTTV